MKIRFTDDELVEIEVEPDISLSAAANNANAVHTCACRGHGRCGTCIVTIEDGIENLTPISEAESRVLRILKAAPNQRLACQARFDGRLTCKAENAPQVKCADALNLNPAVINESKENSS